jgi:catechol 2,3-dioxygenase-like lactoylglutathione lyase family enzyme
MAAIRKDSMLTPISGFDHPVIAVRDMQASRLLFERMGFTVPPRGSHKEWGTGNWCIMFPHDYLELRGIVDASRYTHHLDEFLAKREGLMGVAFSSDTDATEAVASLRARGLHPADPRELTRNFELPEGRTEPRFRLIFFDLKETDGLMASLICQHLTPELIRRPDFLAHANGVTGVHSMTAVTSDLGRAADMLAKYFDAEPQVAADGALETPVGRGALLRFLDPGQASASGMAIDEAQLPYLSAIALRTGSIAQCGAALVKGRIAHERIADKTLRIRARDACGTILDFVEAADVGAPAH